MYFQVYCFFMAFKKNNKFENCLTVGYIRQVTFLFNQRKEVLEYGYIN